MRLLFDSKRGSVLIGTVGLALIGAAVVGGYLTMSLNEYKLAQRTLIMQSAMNLSEAGLERGMNRINLEEWDGWTAVGTNGYYRDITEIPFSDGRRGRIRLYIEDYETLPILASEGRIIDASGRELFRQIRVDLEKRGAFANGLTAKESISFTGNQVSVDAYDSTKNGGRWNSTFNRLDEGSVASRSVNTGALSVGNGDVWGYVATGGAPPDMGPSGSIRGKDSTSRIDETRISDDFYANLWDVEVPTGEVEEGDVTTDYNVDFFTIAAGEVGASGTVTLDSDGNITKINPEVYHITDFTLSGTEQLEVVGPTVIIVDGTLSVGGSAGIAIYEQNLLDTSKKIVLQDGNLEIYAAGDVKIAGNGLLNESLEPLAFQLWGTAPSGGDLQNIYVAGNGDTACVIYAPNAHLALYGNGGISGAAVGHTIKLAGNATFHYDVSLKDFEKNSTFSIERWRELRGTNERLDFSSRESLAEAISPL